MNINRDTFSLRVHRINMIEKMLTRMFLIDRKIINRDGTKKY
jgi:hypothetical protein